MSFELPNTFYIFGRQPTLATIISMRIVRTNLILLLAICSLHLTGLCQLVKEHSFLKDDSILRNKYFDQTIIKKEKLMSAVPSAQAKIYKSIYEEQFKDIEDIWMTSRSITAPEANDYIQSIVQKIIAANAELKGNDARVVFSRDWWPNAASMGEGTIVINAGLVIYMNNEAELVFVLCHELAHYYLEHTPKKIKRYVDLVTSDEYQAQLKQIAKTTYGAGQQVENLAMNTAFGSHRHSREFEAAADKQAFEFMKKTGYDCNAITSTLELLNNVDDTSLYNPVNLPQLLGFPEYSFKKKWIQKESAIFSEMNDDGSPLTAKEKDSLKTHPDCSKRIALLSDAIRSIPAGQKFIVDQSLFTRLKKRFFLEMTEECYRQKNLSRNLYYSLQLLQAGEEKELAIYSIARCLNEIYEKQRDHKLGLSIGTESKGNREDFNLLLRMLGRIRLEEIASLNYNLCKEYQSLMAGNSDFEAEMKKAIKYKQ